MASPLVRRMFHRFKKSGGAYLSSLQIVSRQAFLHGEVWID
jgi:hypothetical protein